MRYLIISLLAITWTFTASAQNINLLDLGPLKGYKNKYIFCKATSNNQYELYIGKHNAPNITTSSTYINQLKNQIRLKKQKKQSTVKQKLKLKSLKNSLNRATNLCKQKVDSNNFNFTPIATPETTISTKSPTATPTPIIETTAIPTTIPTPLSAKCGDGILDQNEICIEDDPLAKQYVELRNSLSETFCQKSTSDQTVHEKQVGLINSANLILDLYLQGDSRAILSDNLNDFINQVQIIKSTCIESTYVPLTLKDLRTFIDSSSAYTQGKLIALNFQHHLVSMKCTNYRALHNYQFDYINYFEDYDVEIYKWYLDFIENCQKFQSGRIVDAELDNYYSDGFVFNIIYKTCDSNIGFAPKSTFNGEELNLKLIYPNLTTTCLEPTTLSKQVYIYSKNNQIKKLKLDFEDFTKEFTLSDVVNLQPRSTPLIADLINIPTQKSENPPGMYDGYYSYPIDGNGKELPFKVMGLKNIAQDLWSNLRNIAPPEQTQALVKLFNYYSYNSSVKSIWNDHPLVRNLDFTGVAWNNDKSGTLITRQHIVVAAHFRRDVGDTIVFTDKAGNAVTRKVVAIKSLERDICIAKLDQPVPDSIKHYKLLYNDIDIVGAPIVVTDRFFNAGIMQVGSNWQNHNITDDAKIYGTHDRTITFIKPDNEYANVNRALTAGDSGHPSFLVINGELILVETHTTQNAGPNYSSFFNQEIIRAAIRELS